MAQIISRWGRLRSQIGSAEVNSLTLALIARWPNAFTEPPRPLMIGIHNDIKMNHPREIISLTMHDWTHRSVYLMALVTGGSRYDLDGMPNGEVSETEQWHAAKILLRRLSQARLTPREMQTQRALLSAVLERRATP
jgi:sRNA-binding protein